MIKNKLAYHFSKIAPYGKRFQLRLNNGLKFTMRSRTMDKAVFKEVWVKDLYGRHDFNIDNADTIIDIGAHIGLFSVYAATKSQLGKVYAFEPFGENFELLQMNLNNNSISNVVAEEVAIDKENGISKLYLSPDNNTGGHSFHLKKNSGYFVDVATLSLASVVEKYELSVIDYLKMDCEGAEFEILYNTTRESLAIVQKLVLECHPYNDYTVEEMKNYLCENGFSVIVEDTEHSGSVMMYARRN